MHEMVDWRGLDISLALIGFPDYPTPTSPGLSNDYYPLHHTVAVRCMEMLGKSSTSVGVSTDCVPRDQPDSSFTGPF